jgi:hypothetical protein
VATKRLSEWADGAGYVDWTYDDATLRLQSFGYQNLTAMPSSIRLTSPTGVETTFVIPAGQVATTRNMLPSNITLVARVGKGGFVTVGPPDGWTYSF